MPDEKYRDERCGPNGRCRFHAGTNRPAWMIPRPGAATALVRSRVRCMPKLYENGFGLHLLFVTGEEDRPRPGETLQARHFGLAVATRPQGDGVDYSCIALRIGPRDDIAANVCNLDLAMCRFCSYHYQNDEYRLSRGFPVIADYPDQSLLSDLLDYFKSLTLADLEVMILPHLWPPAVPQDEAG